MVQPKTILYATDFSSDAEPALRHAAFLARRTKGCLHMLYVRDNGNDPRLSPWRRTQYTEVIEEGVRNLTFAEMARGIDGAGARDLDIVRTMRSGHPVARQILRHAAQIEADLIVMGTHGRRGLRRLFQGSVATQVLHRSPCDVLIVRQGLATTPPEATYQILVPVDVSKPSTEAVALGRRLASSYGANLQLLYVVENNPHPHPLDPPIDPFEWATRIRPEALDNLRRILAETAGPEVTSTVHVTQGRVRSEIASFADGHHSDLIVMARHDHCGIVGSLSGSLTETVVRGAPCPVFTFKGS